MIFRNVIVLKLFCSTRTFYVILNRKKCAKYWPDLNEKLFEGAISVRCQKEQIYAENIFRQLRIQNKTVRKYDYFQIKSKIFQSSKDFLHVQVFLKCITQAKI